MTVKVGDKVRYTGETKHDVIKDRVYKVSQILDEFDRIQPISIEEKGALLLIDDAGDNYWVKQRDYEPITPTEPTEYDYAEQAAKHGIKITVTVGDNVVIFDGKG